MTAREGAEGMFALRVVCPALERRLPDVKGRGAGTTTRVAVRLRPRLYQPAGWRGLDQQWQRSGTKDHPVAQTQTRVLLRLASPAPLTGDAPRIIRKRALLVRETTYSAGGWQTV